MQHLQRPESTWDDVLEAVFLLDHDERVIGGYRFHGLILPGRVLQVAHLLGDSVARQQLLHFCLDFAARDAGLLTDQAFQNDQMGEFVLLDVVDHVGSLVSELLQGS
jgi:hypothetical protein